MQNWNFLGRGGGAKQKTFRGVSMDIFWNCTLIKTATCIYNVMLHRINLGGAHATRYMQRSLQLKHPHHATQITLSRAPVNNSNQARIQGW